MPVTGRCRLRSRQKQVSSIPNRVVRCWAGRPALGWRGTLLSREKSSDPAACADGHGIAASRIVGTGYGRISPATTRTKWSRGRCRYHHRARCTPVHLFPGTGVVLMTSEAGQQGHQYTAPDGCLVQGFPDERQVQRRHGPFSPVVLSPDVLDWSRRNSTRKPPDEESNRHFPCQCAIFAETIIDLLARRYASAADIAADVFRSIARRMRLLAAHMLPPLRGECCTF